MSGPYPWGNRSVEYSEPKTPPTTNITRRYDFTIARGLAAPDGYERHMLLINGQFPGPRIEANWGDWIEVKVTNKIESPAEGTALHWHGMLQRETPWFDGVPSVAQCPIAPGETFTYRFRADQYGTSWYHAHFSAQYAGGAMGPMIIYGPSHVDYDEDLGMVMLSDYFHLDYRTLVERTMSTDVNAQILISDNTLVNGRMPWKCSLKAANDTAKCTGERGYSKWRVKLGKTYRTRLVNSGAAGIEYFSIDNHNVTVIANDFVEVEPYNTKWVTLGVSSCPYLRPSRPY
jgi:FtsP/CotA-like multicopper oxidase with cupredoxin domain